MSNGNIAVLVLGGLLCLGWLYDAFVAHLESSGADRGYRGLLVLPCALLAVLGVWVIAGQDAAWWSLWTLLAAGLLPVIGDTKRSMDRRAKEETEAAKANFANLIALDKKGEEVTQSLQELVSNEGGTHDNE